MLRNPSLSERNLRFFFPLFELKYLADGAVKYSYFNKIRPDY